MLDKMKQIMEVKRQADKLKRELEQATLEISEIKGIKLTVNGAQQFQALKIDGTLLTPDNKDKLESDLLKAVNAAVTKSQSLAAEKMKQMTGFNIPGL